MNATQACFEHNTVVTGDDFGLVKLFRYPCLKKSTHECVHVCVYLFDECYGQYHLYKKKTFDHFFKSIMFWAVGIMYALVVCTY